MDSCLQFCKQESFFIEKITVQFCLPLCLFARLAFLLSITLCVQYCKISVLFCMVFFYLFFSLGQFFFTHIQKNHRNSNNVLLQKKFIKNHKLLSCASEYLKSIDKNVITLDFDASILPIIK